MSTSCLAKGSVVEIDGRPHELIGKVDKATWQLSELQTRRIKEFSDDALRKAYSTGSLRFSAKDPFQLATRERTPRVDFSEVQWEAAKIRRAYVTAILDLPGHKPSILPIIRETWQKLGQPTKPPGASSVLRWKKRFINGGRDITALIERHDMKGNKRERYPKDVTEIVRKSIDAKYLTKERGTMQDALDKAKVEVQRENELRPESIRLPKPTRRLVARMIRNISAYDRCAARYGRQTAQKRYRSMKGHHVSNAPLERVEIDHTQLDIIVVDESAGLPLGRPWLTVCIDMFTRCILGVYIGFEPPSYLTVARCLKQAITPKTWVGEQYKGIKNAWSAHGVMQTLVVDNGLEFHSRSLENACYSLGIEIIYSPRRTPWFKPYVERVIGTLNRAVAHGVPGTTFSSIVERDDYDPVKHAVVRYSVLKEAIYKWIVDVYHQRPHRSLGTSPAVMWESTIAPEDIPLADDPMRLDAILGASETRTLTHKGIELYGLYYNSPQLSELRRSVAEKLEVEVRVDPSDLGKVTVIGPKNGELYSVPALRAEYATGLSLWQHKVCKRYAAHQFERYSPESWLEAKEQISEMMHVELHRRKIKTRAKMARFKGDKALTGEEENAASSRKTALENSPGTVTDGVAAFASRPQSKEAAMEEADAPSDDADVELSMKNATPRRFTPVYRERVLQTAPDESGDGEEDEEDDDEEEEQEYEQEQEQEEGDDK